MLTLSIISVCLLSVVSAFPEGPPVVAHPEICTSMFPTGHNKTAQTSAAPFEFVVEGDCYKENMDVHVRIRVKEGMDTYYEGVMIQARTDQTAGESVGMFSVKSHDPLKTLDCFSQTANTIGQSAKAHYQCHRFTWKASAGLRAAFKFRATMVHETEEFWLGVVSKEIKYDANCEATEYVKCSAPAISAAAFSSMLVLSCVASFIRKLY